MPLAKQNIYDLTFADYIKKYQHYFEYFRVFPYIFPFAQVPSDMSIFILIFTWRISFVLTRLVL